MCLPKFRFRRDARREVFLGSMGLLTSPKSARHQVSGSWCADLPTHRPTPLPRDLGVKRGTCRNRYQRSAGFSWILASALDTHKGGVLFQAHEPDLRPIRFLGWRLSTRKDISRQGSRGRPQLRLCCHLSGRPASEAHPPDNPVAEARDMPSRVPPAPCHRQSLLLPRMGILTHFPFAVRGRRDAPHLENGLRR
jgi:hypothetical protein